MMFDDPFFARERFKVHSGYRLAARLVGVARLGTSGRELSLMGLQLTHVHDRHLS